VKASILVQNAANTMRYEDFIATKEIRPISAGFQHKCSHDWLFDYQKACVEWACSRGRSALFLDTGLGKTNCELAWADAVVKNTSMPVLIVAPLCVSIQIVEESKEFGFSVAMIEEMPADIKPGIYVTNYENLHNIDASKFSGVSLDESSRIKGDGPLSRMVVEMFSNTPYRLSTSATPAPNDYIELGLQSEFLGIMSQVEMMATFFIHDGGDTAKWRLKGHGEKKFFEWLATWSVIMRDPSLFGFTKKPELPPLILESIVIDSGITDGLLPKLAQTLSERISARRDTIEMRCKAAADLVSRMDGQVMLWCALNAEGDLLQKLIPGSVQVSGSDTRKHKESSLMGFAHGDVRILISKPSLAGFGLNFQCCNQAVFVGLSDSWEQYYQAIRRNWRFGQKRTVTAYMVTADIEGAVVENIRRKDAQAERMMDSMAKLAASFFKDFSSAEKQTGEYSPTKIAIFPKWLKSSRKAA